MARFSVRRPRLIVSRDRITTADVARALQVTRDGVRYLVQAGELTPVVTPATGQWLFSRAEVLAVADARTRRRLRAPRDEWRARYAAAQGGAAAHVVPGDPVQGWLPLYRDPAQPKVDTRVRSEPWRVWPANGPRLISTVTDTRAAAAPRRMAKVGLDERHTDRRRRTGTRD